MSQARKADAKSLQDFSEKNKNIEGTNPRRMNEFLLELTKIGDESGPYNYVDIPTDKLKFQQQQEQLAYSDRMEISPEHLVDEGKETFMVASHPSELLSNWSESVFSFLPRTSDVVDAMHATHEKAKDSALNDIGSLPIEVSDERDTYTESGFTMGALAEIIKAEHDFDSHTFKLALYTSSASLGASTTAYSTSNEISITEKSPYFNLLVFI